MRVGCSYYLTSCYSYLCRYFAGLLSYYMQTLLLDAEVLLEKMPMKGGWTYALLPDVIQGGRKNFGWTRVDAMIDDVALPNTSLMPIKGGRLFVAVKAAVRKQIGKEAGATVRIRLYAPQPVVTNVAEADFEEALNDAPDALKRYQSLSKQEQDACRKWVFAPASTTDVIDRIATVINDLAAGRRLRL